MTLPTYTMMMCMTMPMRIGLGEPSLKKASHSFEF
jgi:hypothetical protein